METEGNLNKATRSQREQLMTPSDTRMSPNKFIHPYGTTELNQPLNRYIPQLNSHTLIINQNNQLQSAPVSELIPTSNPIIQTLQKPIQLSDADVTLKCQKYFTYLLANSAEREYNATQKCVQELIDDRTSFQAFCNNIREFRYIEFLPDAIDLLKLGIPLLRQALAEGKMSIAGINSSPIRFAPTIVSILPAGLPLQQNNIVTSSNHIYQQATQMVESLTPQITSNSRLQSPVSNKNKSKKEVSPNVNYKDVNDVVTMGGIDLAEETEIMLNSISYMGLPERSCEEIYLLNIPYLQEKIKSVLATQSLMEFHEKVADVISHALEERLKNWIEDLAVLSEKRLSSVHQQIMKNEAKVLVKFNTTHIGQDDLQSEEGSRSEESSRLDENLTFDPSQASYDGLNNPRLDLYLRENIKTAELEDLVVILKRDKEYCKDTKRPFIRNLLIKLTLG